MLSKIIKLNLVRSVTFTQGWLKAQAAKATALGLKVFKASKKINMLYASRP